jgi:cytochrome c biogenesis protein CcmG, thiol:disulfide interchange protein DsbE
VSVVRGLRTAALGSAAALVLLSCAAGRSSEPAAPAELARSTQPAVTRVDGRLGPCPRTLPATPVEGGLPDLALPCLRDGRAVRLSGVRGTPTVVNVWASWCQPCAAETPFLVAVHRQAGGRVGMLGIAYADRREAAADFLADFGARYPSVEDRDGRTRSPLGFLGPPWTYFVDAGGRVVADHRGQLVSERQLRDLITRHLGVRL